MYYILVVDQGLALEFSHRRPPRDPDGPMSPPGRCVSQDRVLPDLRIPRRFPPGPPASRWPTALRYGLRSTVREARLHPLRRSWDAAGLVGAARAGNRCVSDRHATTWGCRRSSGSRGVSHSGDRRAFCGGSHRSARRRLPPYLSFVAHLLCYILRLTCKCVVSHYSCQSLQICAGFRSEHLVSCARNSM